MPVTSVIAAARPASVIGGPASSSVAFSVAGSSRAAAIAAAMSARVELLEGAVPEVVAARDAYDSR